MARKRKTWIRVVKLSPEQHNALLEKGYQPVYVQTEKKIGSK